ncbi:MAG: hypothetical protein ACREBR_00375, partial [bacterium]
IILHRVLYVPGLRPRLISTTALTDMEHGVLFHPQHVTILLGRWSQPTHYITIHRLSRESSTDNTVVNMTKRHHPVPVPTSSLEYQLSYYINAWVTPT